MCSSNSIIRISGNDLKPDSEKEKNNMCGDAIVYISEKLRGSPDLRAFNVRFLNGAHTKWHRHCGAQILIVQEGLGFIQKIGEDPQDIMPGDQIYISAQVWHRHGAKAGETMMQHLAITIGETEWDKEDCCES